MHRPFLCFVFLVLAALPAVGSEDGCAAEYSAEQCQQMGGGDGGGTGNPNGGSTSGCPYYLCGNATGVVQSAWGWCEATQAWSDCPIGYCEYRSCIGTNCYPTSMTCTGCSSRQGNNLHISSCPRT